jgi:hypothetical protein
VVHLAYPETLAPFGLPVKRFGDVGREAGNRDGQPPMRAAGAVAGPCLAGGPGAALRYLYTSELD